MKTIVCAIAAVCLTSYSSFGQIVSAAQPSVGMAGPVVNTGLSVAPNEDIYATIFDNGLGNYRILWLDEVGATVDGASGHGSDPDIAYYKNADLVYAAYENGGHIVLENHYLASLNPVNYNLGTPVNVGNGLYPNIDCNSSGRGVICWEENGKIFARTFSPGITLGATVLIGTNGTQPDVVAMDNNENVVITYISGGNLIIETYDYADLALGTKTLTNHWHYNGGLYAYKYPRVAADRNAHFGSLNNFTVVVEYQNSAFGNNIEGFFNMSGNMTQVDLNTGLHHCNNNKPVVTYERGTVNVAWASNAGPSCASVPGGLGDNVLFTQYKFDGTKLAPNVYREVNNWANGFANASPSISAEYDGGYAITNTNYHEAIIFNDNGDLFWKGRNVTTPQFYKEAAHVENEGSGFTLLENPVSNFIYLKSNVESEISFKLYNSLGKLVDYNQVTQSGEQFKIGVQGLPKGLYYLECTSGTVQETLKVVL